jgi:hypothetical protein
MREYRLYLLGRDALIKSAIEVECENDEAARRLAILLHSDDGAELWEGARKVAEYPPRHSGGASDRRART